MIPAGGSCADTYIISPYVGYFACKDAIVELGCPKPFFVDLDYYGKCMFTCDVTPDGVP